MTTYLIADEFETDYIRGGQLNDAALVSYLDIPITKIRSINLNAIEKDAFYIIGNFIGIPEEIKIQLAKEGNYVIYEKDHKYACVPGYPRHPLVWPDGIVPADKLRWESFYNGARAVITLTKWHQLQVEKNLPKANIECIHGSLWSAKELDIIDYIRENVPHSRGYGIQNIYYKNPQAAIEECNKRYLRYTLIPKIDDKERFLKALCSHKSLVFFPNIPETCSRLLVEAKMLGLDVITNKLSGAVHEPWFQLRGKELTDHFRNKIIPDAIKLFKRHINECS